jgi:hypothetical protein
MSTTDSLISDIERIGDAIVVLSARNMASEQLKKKAMPQEAVSLAGGEVDVSLLKSVLDTEKLNFLARREEHVKSLPEAKELAELKATLQSLSSTEADLDERIRNQSENLSKLSNDLENQQNVSNHQAGAILPQESAVKESKSNSVDSRILQELQNDRQR